MNRPQESHCDLGLVEDDHTEDLRKTRNAPDHQLAGTRSEATDHTPPKEPIMTKSTATTQTSPWIVREKGVDTEWLADEVVTVDGDSDTGWVEFIAVADRDFDVEIVTELWITPKYGATIKIGNQPHQWHAALDALTKVVAALDAAYAEKDA